MANIRDVARRAGVSIATVSATLNRSSPVSEETQRRVWEAVEAVGYAPNAIARSLRLGKSRLIGIVVGDITNPFWATMVRAVESVALAARYSIIVCNTDDDPERELTILNELRAQRVAGILLTPVGEGDDYKRYLEHQNLPPMVTIDQRLAGLRRDYVGVDNRAAARMLTEFMIRLGHRRIAVVTGRKGLWTAEERLAAAVETMERADIEVDPSLCMHTAYRTDAGYAAAMTILTHSDPPPTAFVCGNNVIALGALQASQDLGYRCPEDISIAGIDDLPWSALVRPRITTVAQPIEAIGKVAIEWLLERIAADAASQPAPRSRIFPPTMIVGDSCAPAPMPAKVPASA